MSSLIQKKYPINYFSNDWISVRQRLHEEREVLLEKLQDLSKDIGETQALRGQLVFIKKILNWEEKPE